MMPQFQLACPESISEVMHVLEGIEGEIAFLSGGTDLILEMNEGRKHPDWVIDLSQIPELRFIRSDGERIRIGSATTFTDISRSPLLVEKARCLVQAASQVGSLQIRNRATLGGNIAGASPAGDSLTALLALDARVNILGPAGERRISFARFQSEPGQGLHWGEFINGIDFPSEALEHTFSEEPESKAGGMPRLEVWGHTSSRELGSKVEGMSPSKVTRTSNIRVSAFGKIGSRRTVTIARLNMAAMLEIEASRGVIRKAGLVLGALGRVPFRLGEIEENIRGRRFDDSLINDLVERLTETVDQAIPGRYSREYKRQAIRGLAADVLDDLAGQLSN